MRTAFVLPLIVVIFSGSHAGSAAYGEIMIPDWVKNVAGFWATGHITDAEYAVSIKYLIQEGIISIDPERDANSTTNAMIGKDSQRQGLFEIDIFVCQPNDVKATVRGLSSQEYTWIGYEIYLLDDNGKTVTAEERLIKSLKPGQTIYINDHITYAGSWEHCGIQINSFEQLEPSCNELDTLVIETISPIIGIEYVNFFGPSLVDDRYIGMFEYLRYILLEASYKWTENEIEKFSKCENFDHAVLTVAMSADVAENRIPNKGGQSTTAAIPPNNPPDARGPHPSDAVTFRDSTGHMPEFAKDKSNIMASTICSNAFEELDGTRDGDWCMEFTAYIFENLGK